MTTGRRWSVASAKAHFSTVLAEAEKAPQVVERRGRPVAQADMLVAACALTAGLVLATRNVKDFEHCGVALFDPFAH
jgi:predicted nucleic acid-binding protein